MIFSTEGSILGGDYTEYELIIGENGCVEQDAGLWWESVKNSVKNTIRHSQINGKNISALSISSQGISFVPLDRYGNTLMNAVSWLDTRASEEAEAVAGTFGAEKIFRLTGKIIFPTYVLPKIMWVKRHHPDIYNNTWKFMMAMDFLLYRFCGKAVTDYSMASGTLAYDIAEKRWCHEILGKMDIDPQKLPEIKCTGSAAGAVLPAIAEELGLSPECYVITGAQDQRCAALGAGIAEGVVTVSLGTAAAVCSICSEPIADGDTGVSGTSMDITCCGFDENHWMLESVVSTSGAALKWVKNTFFKNYSYAEMDELAKCSPAGSRGVMFYPHLGNTGAVGKGAFTGLGIHIAEGDIIRSVLEGISYQIRAHIKSHEIVNGSIRQIRLFGGGAKSGVWAQMIADITGKAVAIPGTHETANLGAAILAGVGAGFFRDCREALKAIGTGTTDAKVFLPDPEKHRDYDERYKVYCSLNKKIYNK